MKVIRITSGIALRIPADIVRALEIHAGEYFDLLISDKDTIVARRIKIVTGSEFGEVRDDTVPTIQNGEPSTKN